MERRENKENAYKSAINKCDVYVKKEGEKMQQKNECAFVCLCERAVGLCGMWCSIKQG